MMSQMRVAAFFKALGHPTRLGIIERIASGECCVSDMEDELDCRQANISQHLAILRDRGLVVPVRKGKRVCYQLTDKRIANMVRQVRSLIEGLADKQMAA